MSFAIAHALKKRQKKMCNGGKMYAEGGQVKDNYQSPSTAMHQDKVRPIEEKKSGYVEHEGDVMRPNAMAIEEDDLDLGQHGAKERGPYGGAYAKGGEIESAMEGEQSEDDELDMVGRILKKHFSKGGMVANDDEPIAEFKPNQFDDLALRDDDMEDADYTGANSGDEKGNAAMDARDGDVIRKIMASRAKKGRMPRPA